MGKIIDFESKKEHYEADACVVWCFDDRFTAALQKTAEFLRLKNYDLIKIAGGAKSLASPEKAGERDFVLKQILISINLHQAKTVVLMNHSDCGAYCGINKFAGEAEKEKEFYKTELLKAKNFLAENLPEKIKTQIIFVDFEKIYSV